VGMAKAVANFVLDEFCIMSFCVKSLLVAAGLISIRSRCYSHIVVAKSWM
jgi:hypothetical protein